MGFVGRLHKKTVQHLEGGIIDNILVQDGDFVNANQLLMQLDKTKALTELEMTQTQLDSLQVRERRLQAEEANSTEIDLTGLDQNNPRLKILIQTQQNLLHRRQAEQHNKKEIANQRLHQQQTHLTSLIAKARANDLKIEMLADKLAGMEKLHEQDFIARHALLELKSTYEESISQRDIIISEQQSTKIKLLELEHEIRQLDFNYSKTLTEEYQSVYTELEASRQKQIALQSTLLRTEIRAPVAGIIADLQHHTLTGVVTTGQKILEIVPQDAPLFIEAEIMDKDIKRIAVGMEVKIQLEAYKARRMPKLQGEVIYISADKTHNNMQTPSERDKQVAQGAMYKAHIKVADTSLAKLTQPVELQTGLPVTVFIVKGQRSLLEYWFDPLRDSFYKAMKEE